MKEPIFTGVCTALVTPFLDDRINYPMLEVLIRRQIASGVKAIVLAGTTGESPTLTDDEKLELFRRGKTVSGKNALIIAGTGSNDTSHTVAMSIAAQEAGADALLVVTPYYNKANAEGLFAHYLAVAHAVSIPVIIYNVPSRTGVDIPISVCARLSRIPNVVGIKEASTDITRITALRNACGAEFSIWSGNDSMTLPVMAAGGIGVISVASNVAPAELVDLCKAVLDGDLDTAISLQETLSPLFDLLCCDINPMPVKAAMRAIGYDCGGCRLPLTGLTPSAQDRIQKYFSK